MIDGVNRKLAAKVADAIEGRTIPSLGFDMRACAVEITDPKSDEIRHPRKDRDCGTTACIAGWVCIVSGVVRSPKALRNFSPKVADTAAKKLGLNIYESQWVFYDHPGVSDTQAVKALRYMARTGRVKSPREFAP